VYGYINGEYGKAGSGLNVWLEGKFEVAAKSGRTIEERGYMNIFYLEFRLEEEEKW